MLREQEQQLWDFCAGQRSRFNPTDWSLFHGVERNDLALAAAFLSMCDWFGHEEVLGQIAENLQPDVLENFPALASLREFDLSRFTNMLRRELDERAC